MAVLSAQDRFKRQDRRHERALSRQPTVPARNIGDRHLVTVALEHDLGLHVLMRDRQRLIRTLIEDIIADIDEATGEIVLVIHWKGGRHTELRTMKPKTGEHGAKTSDEALGIIREMAGRWSDESISACLNRTGMQTGQGKTWNAKRVSSIRRVNDIHGYLSADKTGPYRTMTEAAKELGVTNHVIRRLIKDGILQATRLVEGAPYQIRAEDLHSELVQVAITRKGRPCRAKSADQLSMFPSTDTSGRIG